MLHRVLSVCNALCMTMQPGGAGTVPEWTIGDRMRKSLHHSDVGVQEMADYLGVARNTVSNWINGHIEPSLQTLRLWSMRTGVPLEWLRTGWAPRGSNPQPTGYQTGERGGRASNGRTRWLVDSRRELPVAA